VDAASWDRLFAQREWLFPLRPNPLVVELVSSLPRGRVLELGVGEGRHAVWLAEQGWHVTAVEFSRVALDRARGRARSSGVAMTCVLAHAADALATTGEFDLVLIAYMHPEPHERDTVFAAAAEAVAPGGHLLVLGVDTADPKATRGAGEIDWRFTPALLAGAFPGITLIRCEQVARAVENEPGGAQAIDTLAWGYRRPTGA